MTTRQSTTLHMSGDGEDPNNGLAFSTIDGGNPDTGENGELYPALEVWGTIQAPDGQVLTARMQVPMPDVRDLQAFLNDNYARNKAPKSEPEASLQTQIDNAGAQYFRDGWTAALAQILQLTAAQWTALQIQEWAANQVTHGQPDYPEPGEPLPVEHEPTTSDVNDLAFYDVPNDPWQPKPGDTVNVFPMTATMPDGEQKPGFVVTPRQCPHISNGVQCTATAGHDFQHQFAASTNTALCSRIDPHHHMQDSSGVHWVHDGSLLDCPAPDNHYPIEVVHATHQPDVDLFQEQAAAIQHADGNHTPQDLSDNPHSVQHPDNQVIVDLIPNLVPGPKNTAEQERKRRLKVEIAFDEAAAAYRVDPFNQGAVHAINKAANDLRDREPDNSRLANWDGVSGFAAAQATAQAEQPEQLPEAHFAPEPAPGYQPIPYNGGDPSPHVAEEQMERAQFPGTDPTQMTTAQQAWTNNPDGSASFSPIAAEQSAAQAFPCPHKASDERPCQRPAGHEIELPNRPAVPHVYATNPATLPVNANNTQYLPVQQPPAPAPYVAPVQPFQQPHLQAVPDQTNVAVMSFHENEPGMPAAPAMPTWQAPQQ